MAYQAKFIAFIKPIIITESNELFDNQFTQHSPDKRWLMVTCDNNRLIIGFIDISECMVAYLNLVHQNKLNTVRNKSTVVAGLVLIYLMI